MTTKNETKHTPGPWSVVQGQRIYGDATRIMAGSTVAVVPCDATAEVEDGAIVEVLSLEAKANAHLIAAAPDLLAALRALANRCEDLGMASPYHGSSAVVADAFAAIAKAEGR